MKIKLLVIFILLPVLLLTGCWSSHELNTLAITIAIGIDKSENGYLLTIEAVNPKAIASKVPTMSSPVVLYTEEGRNLEEIMRGLSTKSGRIIYTSHLRIVVINEDVAKEGIKDILDFFARYYQLRTDFYFTVAKGATAEKVLSILPPLGEIPGIKLYDSLNQSELIWAPTKSIRIVELINDIIADGKNPVLTVVGVTEEMPGNKMPTNSIQALQGSEVANRTKYLGLAAFEKDKLVGWLDEEESKGCNYITGNVKRTVGHVNYGDKVEISAEAINAESVIKAFMVNEKPAINVEISINQNIGAVMGEFDVSKEDNLVKINELSEERIKSMCEKSLAKAKELKTDIFGFGEAIHKKYPKEWKKIKDNWNDKFTELPVSITVNVKTNQLGQVTKPFFIKEKE